MIHELRQDADDGFHDVWEAIHDLRARVRELEHERKQQQCESQDEEEEDIPPGDKRRRGTRRAPKEEGSPKEKRA